MERTAHVTYRKSRRGWHIILTAANGAKLGPIGQAYSTKAKAKRGWAAICRAAATAVEQ